MNESVLVQNAHDRGTAFTAEFVCIKTDSCFDPGAIVGDRLFTVVTFMNKHFLNVSLDPPCFVGVKLWIVLYKLNLHN